MGRLADVVVAEVRVEGEPREAEVRGGLPAGRDGPAAARAELAELGRVRAVPAGEEDEALVRGAAVLDPVERLLVGLARVLADGRGAN